MPCNEFIVLATLTVYKHIKKCRLQENKQTSNTAPQELIDPKTKHNKDSSSDEKNTCSNTENNESITDNISTSYKGKLCEKHKGTTLSTKTSTKGHEIAPKTTTTQVLLARTIPAPNTQR